MTTASPVASLCLSVRKSFKANPLSVMTSPGIPSNSVQFVEAQSAQDCDDLIQWFSVLAAPWNHLERFKTVQKLMSVPTQHYSNRRPGVGPG